MENQTRYIPALRFRWLTRFYDPVLRVTLKEARFKGLLVEQADIRPTHKVLDLGCGTATLTLLVKERCPEAEVIGLDGDAEVLAIARAKARQVGSEVMFYQGLASQPPAGPPFEPGSFARVVSSLVFHHLDAEEKRRALRTVHRLLRPGGQLHIADWGQAQNALMRIAFLGVQLLDGFRTTTDNVRGRLVPLLDECGFVEAAETHREMTALGTLSLYRGVKPHGS